MIAVTTVLKIEIYLVLKYGLPNNILRLRDKSLAIQLRLQFSILLVF